MNTYLHTHTHKNSHAHTRAHVEVRWRTCAWDSVTVRWQPQRNITFLQFIRTSLFYRYINAGIDSWMELNTTLCFQLWSVYYDERFSARKNFWIIDWEFIQGIEYKNGISIGSMTIRSQDMFSSISFLIILFILKINQWWCCSITSPEFFVFGFLCYLLNCSDSNINSE